MSEYASQGHVQRVRAYDRLPGERQVSGHKHEGPVLPTTEATVAAHEVLERRDLLGARIDDAVDIDVRCFGPQRHPEHELVRMWAVGCQPILALPPVVDQPQPSAGAEHHRAFMLVEHYGEADAGVAREPVDEGREPRVELLPGELPPLPADVDET